MPNHVENTIYMKDIGTLPLYSFYNNGEEYFDFNKLIPMPPSLEMTEGGIMGHAINETIKYLIFQLSGGGIDGIGLILGPYRRMNRLINGNISLSKVPKELRYEYPNRSEFECGDITHDQLLEIGMAYIRNIVKYGYPTWYYWCITNWGTKWNSYEFRRISHDCIAFNTAWSIPKEIYIELSKRYPDREIIVDWINEGGTEGIIKFYNGECVYEDEGKWSYGLNDEEMEIRDYIKPLFLCISRSGNNRED